MADAFAVTIPKVYQEFCNYWDDEERRRASLDAYESGQCSFIPALLPEHAGQLSGSDTLAILRARLGSTLDIALDAYYTDPDHLPDILPGAIQSPVINESNGTWLKRSNVVGVNVRTIQSFWNIVKYALTLPAAQDTIQLLPIWEPGVVGSLYGMSSWELNPEFYSPELAECVPHLSTKERQLRAVVNILHAMGKRVGMDVVPHTDRFAQIVLAYPEYFEWLQRQDTQIISHADNLHEVVQARILEFVAAHGPAVAEELTPATPDELFGEEVAEARRLRVLFGEPDDPAGRNARRVALIQYLYQYGYEPVPATMAPPFRGLQIDTRGEAKIVDASGMTWRDYQIAQPQPMSRVFGPLARYKYYGTHNNNRDWQLDFNQPNIAVWNYVCAHYAEAQRRYGFDFMRGDMAHVQMRPAGVPDELDRYYDILGAIKQYIRQTNGVRYFGYLAEAFLAARDVFGYGEEMDHLEASEADTVLGDLQSTVVGSAEFLRRFRQYSDWAATRQCTPSFTVMTGDKDDPRFDEFYRQGNEARLFIALFLTDLPSYMALGFETRDVHYAPAPNEHYTKLFVFHEESGPKATQGPYIWGKNGFLYHNLTRLRLYADTIWSAITGRPTRWLLPPDATGENPILAWTQADDHPEFIFLVNTSAYKAIERFGIPQIPQVEPQDIWKCTFSTMENLLDEDRELRSNGKQYRVRSIEPGECRVYRI